MVVVTTKIDPIDRDIALLIANDLSEKAQSRYLAEFAIESVTTVAKQNAAVLGSQVDYKTFVDGVFDASEFSVKPKGRIVYEFQLIAETLEFIGKALEQVSPVLSGDYQKSHTLFADGIEVSKGVNIPAATEYTFVSTLPYAGKIERGQSSQAPGGVYEITAHEAGKRYGNIAKISFIDYVGVFGVMSQSPNARYGRQTTLKMNKASNRFPAIRISLGR